jgi:hypothetical protein
MREEALAGKRGDKWKVVDGLLTIVGWVYVLASSAHVQTLLAAAHDIGHEGTEKTLHHLLADFYIPGARTSVREFVWACTVCQQNKTEHLHWAGLLQPLELPSVV